MKKQNIKHDENGKNGHCIAFWKDNGSCGILRGPRVCPSSGDANLCFLKHPNLYTEYCRKKIKKELIRVIRENLNPGLVDLNRISHDIMKKFSVRLKNNMEE